jgi:competence transcription factor ComK
MIPTKRVRDYDNIWINYAAIDEIILRSGGIEIYFFGERQIYLKYSLNTLKNQIKVLSFIRSSKVKHFHS